MTAMDRDARETVIGLRMGAGDSAMRGAAGHTGSVSQPPLSRPVAGAAAARSGRSCSSGGRTLRNSR